MRASTSCLRRIALIQQKHLTLSCRIKYSKQLVIKNPLKERFASTQTNRRSRHGVPRSENAANCLLNAPRGPSLHADWPHRLCSACFVVCAAEQLYVDNSPGRPNARQEEISGVAVPCLAQVGPPPRAPPPASGFATAYSREPRFRAQLQRRRLGTVQPGFDRL